MFGLESGSRYYLCLHPVSMTGGIDVLFNMVYSESPLSPMTGDVFVFISKSRHSVKLLKWDTDGLLVYHKRLATGTFEVPEIRAEKGFAELAWETFNLMMCGVSLKGVRYCKRHRMRSYRV